MATSDTDNELVFLPLGGAGEIGMNLNLYGFGPEDDQDWLMVDLGVTFGDPTTPGIDVIMPDPSFIEQRKDRLLGLVLTHAHEDHLGAVPYLWPKLECPIYATPFTVSILRRKLREAKLLNDVDIIEIPLSGTFTIGPFDIELITLTHSIPEPNAMAITTPLGTVMHTGDWKLDPDPVIGDVADEEALKRVGDNGVLAIVCDSTNVLTKGTSGSEADLLEGLTRAIDSCEGRVAVACFASNVARLETISKAAAACGRDTGLAGRSLVRMDEAARENGYLADVPAFIAEEEIGFLPKDKIAFICTGSQGERRAALARIAEGSHPHVTLGEGDTVIFSSRVIPGNEVGIANLQNMLVQKGIRIITWEDEYVHVSGHPAEDELLTMYNHIRPEIAVPVHGEYRHLAAHVKLAKSCQVPHAVLVENGGMVKLAPGKPGIVDQVPAGRLALEGNRVVPIDSALNAQRKRTLYNGAVVATVVLDKVGNLVADPQFTTTGLVDTDEYHIEDAMFDAVEEALDKLSRKALSDDDKTREALRLAVRRCLRFHLDKNPQTTIHLVRV